MCLHLVLYYVYICIYNPICAHLPLTIYIIKGKECVDTTFAATFPTANGYEWQHANTTYSASAHNTYRTQWWTGDPALSCQKTAYGRENCLWQSAVPVALPVPFCGGGTGQLCLPVALWRRPDREWELSSL